MLGARNVLITVSLCEHITINIITTHMKMNAERTTNAPSSTRF